MNKLLLCVFSVYLLNTIAQAQAPIISYTGPQVYTTGKPISNLSVVNTGGEVPATSYGEVITFAGTAGIPGKVNGTGAAAKFSFPQSIAADASGNIYVNDSGNNIIRKLTPSGLVSTFAGSGAYGSDNGPAATATFLNVNGLTVDMAGNVYVAETSNNDIRKITPDGVVSTFAGQIGIAGFANGQGTQATFSNPLGLWTDNTGNIYVADYINYLIRKITPGGLVSTLAGQPGIPGGINGPTSVATLKPTAGVADRRGNFFIVDKNLIRKISTDGEVSTFAGSGAKGSNDGTGIAASFNEPYAITIDAAGNLYVGDNGNYTIRKITPSGVVTTFAGLAGVSGSNDGIGASARLSGASGLAIDLYGSLYFADVLNATIRKVPTTGYSIDKPLPAGLIFDAKTGEITGIPSIISPAADYTITAYNAGGSSSTKINIRVTGNLSFPPITTQVYGVADFSPAISNDGLISYTSSNLSVATVVAGKIHVLGAGNSTITATNGSTSIQQPLTVKPAPLNIIANNLSKAANTVNPPLTVTYSGFANSDGAANLTRQPAITTVTTTTSAAGSYPIIASGAAGPNYSIYYTAGTLTVLGGAITTAAPAIKYPTVPTYVNGTLIAPLPPINTGGNVVEAVYAQVSTIAGTPNVTGSANGTGGAASFGQPYGVAFDGDGNLYITEQVNNLIRKITPGGVVTTFAGSGVAGYADGTGAAAQFNFPTGIAINAAGEIIVADHGSGILRKISPQGVVSYYAGGGSSLNGQLNQASFYGPEGLAFDRAGNLFVADGFNLLIRKITPAGIVSTFAGRQGIQGHDDGPGTSATFMQPAGIATDALGNVYVTDLYIIRKITPDGTVSTLAGSGLNGSKDGIGAEATFGIPQGITADAAGNVYVMDMTNLRKITPEGRVTTIAGVGNEPGSTDGIGTAARFFFASGLTISPAGDLHASDYSTIRKISLNGYSIDKILPQGLSFDPTTGIISGTPTAPSPSTIYTITANNINGGSTTSVTIKVASTDASLANFAINSGVISPSFSSNILNYTANVNNSVASVAVIPTANDKNSTIKINGIIVNSGTVSGNIALTVGTNVITASVIAENGATSKTYTLNITRAPATNANLANLIVSDATLSPSFASATTAYSALVSNSVAAVTVTSVTSSSVSTVKVNGSIVTSGLVSRSLPLNVGNNIITIMVTAQDGITTQTYTLAVNRAKADQAITFATLQPVTYGAEDLTLKATSSNASLPITYSSSNALVAIIINGKIHINGAGTTTITATQAGDAGYSDAVAVKQAFVVNKMPLTVTVNDVFRTYGKNNPDFTIAYDGFVNGDNLATLSTLPTVSTTANITTAEGVYDLIPAGAVASNYSFNYIKGKLTITVPVDNIKVSAVSATCKNQNDGSINIAAVRKLNYTASLAGKTYTFNDKLAVGNLTPGSYTVCITADGLPDYNQCFTLTITEPLDLSVYSVVNKQVNTVSLSLSGSDTYTIVLNGKTYQTKNNSITLPLFAKINKLIVNGDKLCQGVIERDIVGSDNMVPYPNPFQNLVYLNLGETVQSACVVKIVNMTDGKVKVMQTFTNQSGIIQINVSGLSLGVYALQLTTDDNRESVYKIIKK